MIFDLLFLLDETRPDLASSFASSAASLRYHRSICFAQDQRHFFQEQHRPQRCWNAGDWKGCRSRLCVENASRSLFRPIADGSASFFRIPVINSDSGESVSIVDGNNGDRNNISAWMGGDQLVLAVAAKNKNTIVIVHSVGVMDTELWIDVSQAEGVHISAATFATRRRFVSFAMSLTPSPRLSAPQRHRRRLGWTSWVSLESPHNPSRGRESTNSNSTRLITFLASSRIRKLLRRCSLRRRCSFRSTPLHHRQGSVSL